MKAAKLSDISVGTVEQFQGQVKLQSAIDNADTDIILEPGTESNHFGHYPKQRGESSAEIIRSLGELSTHERSVFVLPTYIVDIELTYHS